MVGAETATLDERSAPEPRTRVRLCGPLVLEVDGHDLTRALPGGQAATLLCHLLAEPARAAPRDRLIDAVWGGAPPRDPHAALRPLLSRLRRALAPATIEGRERLHLALPEPVWIDVDESARALAAARDAAAREDWQTARDQADAGLELLRPGLLPGQRSDWVEARRRELEERELEALELVARSALALGGGDLGVAERAGRELIARASFRETGYRFTMEALAAGGNVAEALRVYEQLRLLLRDELGAVPAAELQELHGLLLTGDGAAPPHGNRATAEGSDRVPLPSALAPRVRSPFVGREDELQALAAAWRRARTGSRQVVLVVGEPGIGKTRLTTEFARAAHADGTVLYAGCQQEAVVSYQPFVEALGHYVRGLPGGASIDLGPGATELGRMIPELAEPASAAGAPATVDPETRRYLMFEAVATLIAQASASAPLLLVLDDLHWADRATVHLLRHVVRTPHRTSVLIVGTYRDAEVGSDHPISELVTDLRRDRLLQRIALEGLDEGGVGALLTSERGQQPPSGLAATVRQHTEGNPFFVEEVMRHLIETGVVFEHGGRWASALKPDEIGVPEGVKDVLVRRLAHLTDECRRVLSDAAVLGREFSFDVLGAMADVGEDALIAALEEAVDARLIVELDGGGPAPTYGFTHALVRETLYGGLSGPRRQRMHARAADAIELMPGDDSGKVAAVALHLRLAGSAGDAAKAIDYSLRAGGQAAELFAWEEAAAHWDGAVAMMARAGGRERERAALLVALADLMVVIGALGRQIEYLEQALGLAEELEDDERAAQTHSRLGMALSLIDDIYSEHLDVRRAFHHFDAAREVLERGRPRKARGHLEAGVATALTYALRTDEGLAAGQRAMEIAERFGDELLWASGAQTYAWHAIVSGQLHEGMTTVERAFEVADRHKRPFLAFMGSQMRGQMTWGLWAPDEAQTFFERPMRLAYMDRSAYRRELADAIGRCHASRGEFERARGLAPDARPAWLTHALRPLLGLWDGDWDGVDALAARTLATSRRTGNRWDEFASLHFAGVVRHLRGELEPAIEILEQALEITVDGGAVYYELWVRPDLARALAERGDLEAARGHADRCRKAIDTGEDWRGREGQVVLADAVVLALEGRLEQAGDAFRAAQSTFAEYRLPVQEADALHEWGRALVRAGQGSTATEKLDEALGIYRRHGAGKVWLERARDDRPSTARR